jgi:PEP-CTERM putative exosortase interaction domain
MQLRQYPLAFLATTLLLTITEQQGVAFTLTYQPGGSYTALKQYQLSNGGQGIVQTSEPFVITSIEMDNFLENLRTAFPASTGWTFNQATKDIAGNQVPFDLAGSFNVSVYNADVRYQPTYLGLFEPVAVGAQIKLHYTAGLGDPIPAINQLHWIQWVRSNHSYATNTHGDNEDVIDVPSGQSNPFYDLIPGIAYTDEENFADGPKRFDIENDHLWSAELFLVEVPDPIKPKTVTVYNGISWGWRNLYTPPISLPPLPCDGSSGGGGCVTTANNFGIRELPLSDFDSGDPNQLPEKVPEPTTIFGLLALGAAGTIKILKNKFNKQ